MSHDHLRKFLEGQTTAGCEKWYLQQILVARSLRNRLAKLSGTNLDAKNDPSELPSAEEIVSETLIRIRDQYSPRYVWDGAGTLSHFFAECMARTLNSLRSAERRHRLNASKLLSPDVDLFLATPLAKHREVAASIDDSISHKDAGPALAAAIAKTRMRGPVKTYAWRLADYAEGKSTTEEIAADLKVKVSSVEAFRRRDLLPLNAPDFR